MCAAKTNTKVPRNSKRQAGGCLLRPGLVNFARLAVKSAGNLLFLRLLALKRRFSLRRCACSCATSTDAGGSGCLGARIAGAFAFFGASAQVQRLHFLQCAHGGDSSRRRGRAFTPPTWVRGRKRRRSERKPAVTRGRYKYFISGETGSQINSTRGHINDGVVKIFDSPKGDC